MMMQNLTALSMSFGERVAYSGRMFLIGMMTVFSVLSILWGALVLFRLAITRGERRAKKSKEVLVPPPFRPYPAQLVRSETAAEPVATGTDDAVIAAITAAVAATLAQENGGVVPAFRVVSFRKIPTVADQKGRNK